MFSPLLLSLVVKLRTVVLPYFLPEVGRLQLKAGALLGGSVGVSSLKASDWRSAGRKRKPSTTSAKCLIVYAAASQGSSSTTLSIVATRWVGERGGSEGAANTWLAGVMVTNPKRGVTSQRADFCSEFCPLAPSFQKTEATEGGKRGRFLLLTRSVKLAKCRLDANWDARDKCFAALQQQHSQTSKRVAGMYQRHNPVLLLCINRRGLKVEDTLTCSFHFTSLSVARFLNGC